MLAVTHAEVALRDGRRRRRDVALDQLGHPAHLQATERSDGLEDDQDTPRVAGQVAQLHITLDDHDLEGVIDPAKPHRHRVRAAVLAIGRQHCRRRSFQQRPHRFDPSSAHLRERSGRRPLGWRACGALIQPKGMTDSCHCPVTIRRNTLRPAVLEPEEGFEPSTFRLRVGPKSSNWTRPGPSWLLRCGTDSIQCHSVPADSNAWVAKEVATPPGLARMLPSVRRLDHPIASEGHSSETSMVLRSPNTLSPPSVTSPGGRGADDPVSDQLKGPSACRPVLRAEASIHPSSTSATMASLIQDDGDELAGLDTGCRWTGRWGCRWARQPHLGWRTTGGVVQIAWRGRILPRVCLAIATSPPPRARTATRTPRAGTNQLGCPVGSAAGTGTVGWARESRSP